MIIEIPDDNSIIRDLIRREDLIRMITIECNPYGAPTIDYESGLRVLEIIDRAPTIYPICFDNEGLQGKWIPVSKSLPEINVDVIVTDIETIGTYSAYYLGDGFWACDNGTYNNRIIAWMPFPDPYKEGSKYETDN